MGAWGADRQEVQSLPSVFDDGERGIRGRCAAEKTKELIAIGISVRIDRESCMQWHIERAAQAGATCEEILEAVEVGIEMGGGPTTVSARFALAVMEELFGTAP